MFLLACATMGIAIGSWVSMLSKSPRIFIDPYREKKVMEDDYGKGNTERIESSIPVHPIRLQPTEGQVLAPVYRHNRGVLPDDLCLEFSSPNRGQCVVRTLCGRYSHTEEIHLLSRGLDRLRCFQPCHHNPLLLLELLKQDRTTDHMEEEEGKLRCPVPSVAVGIRPDLCSLCDHVEHAHGPCRGWSRTMLLVPTYVSILLHHRSVSR
jgi:hypothetical protein